ncbi:hypothetical protein [Klebsiella aerogenes]|uniref:hypothetical protein n=1 Tax=Klebsiella aerogenes TaxID=548 RepID=UPI003D32192F
MRVAEHLILAALQQGGCIKTFYRIPAQKASTSAVRIPSGYVLETPGPQVMLRSAMLIFPRWRKA